MDAYPWQKLTWPMGRWAKNRPIRNTDFLWWSCLLMDWDKISNLYRGPSIDASYQASVHMAEGFQRRRLKCEQLTDDSRRTTDAKWWQKLTLPLARWANNGDYIPQNHPIQLRYLLFFMRGPVVRNRRHNVDASNIASNAYFDEIMKQVKYQL